MKEGRKVMERASAELESTRTSNILLDYMRRDRNDAARVAAN
jgi:hypothetical protein